MKTGSEQKKNVDSFIYEFLGFSLFSHNTDALEDVSEMWARGGRCTSPVELVRAGSSLLETRGRTRSALWGQKKTLWRWRPPSGSVAIPLLRFTVHAVDRLPV